MRKIFFFILAIILLGGGYLVLQKTTSAKELVVNIPDGLSRSDLADLLGRGLSWNEREKNDFQFTHSQMQWMAFHKDLATLFAERFNWTAEEKEIFLTTATKYSGPEFDFTETLYASGTYVFLIRDTNVTKVAGLISSRADETAKEDYEGFIEAKLDDEHFEKVGKIMSNETELLPDLIPLPPADLVVEKSDDGENVYLRFSTIYYNQGRGALELRADPAKADIRADIENDVLQRIYSIDGGFRERVAGTFMWHQEHLHYHYSDFVIYDLEPVEVEGVVPDLSGSKQKSTFCIRDVSRIDVELEYRTDAKYLICGKKLQGISVGWGDTYFYNYPDQILNITDLPTGIYKLSFDVNPADKFEETTKGNNLSSATFRLDMENLTVEIIEEFPASYPTLEHVYPEQKL